MGTRSRGRQFNHPLSMISVAKLSTRNNPHNQKENGLNWVFTLLHSFHPRQKESQLRENIGEEGRDLKGGCLCHRHVSMYPSNGV